MNESVVAAVNDQIKLELDSAYLYLAMAADFQARGLPGFAHWMKLQYTEENAHAHKFIDFLHERGARVQLKALEQPKGEFGTPTETFQQVLAHEQHVTASIHRLYELAMAEKDYPTTVMLHWFIDEQVEEEASAQAILDELRIGGDAGTSLLRMDRHLRRRGE